MRFPASINWLAHIVVVARRKTFQSHLVQTPEGAIDRTALDHTRRKGQDCYRGAARESRYDPQPCQRHLEKSKLHTNANLWHNG